MRARAGWIGAVLVALCSCAEPDPTYGKPGAILKNTLPNDVTGSPGGAFGGAYDANANKPTTTMTQSHQGKAGTPQQISDSLDCLSCHKTGGTAPEFTFGGRVTSKGAPAPNADVLVVVDGQKLGPVKSDSDGFFWSPGAALKEGGKAFVRGADGEREMGQALKAGAAGGGCDSANCHVPDKVGKISL